MLQQAEKAKILASNGYMCLSMTRTTSGNHRYQGKDGGCSKNACLRRQPTHRDTEGSGGGALVLASKEETKNLREEKAGANAFPRAERTLKFAIKPTS